MRNGSLNGKARRGARQRETSREATNEDITVEFSVDSRSRQLLDEVTRDSDSSSIGNTLGAALRILRVLQEQAKEGYCEVIVQNPETLDRRLLMIDFLEPLRRPA